MRIIKYLLVLQIILLGNKIWCQTDCPNNAMYETDSVRFGDNVFPNAQYYILKNDTIKVVSKFRDSNKELDEDLIFIILERKCSWNENFTQGNSNYKLSLKDEDGEMEYPTLKIEINSTVGTITMQYPTEKVRVSQIVVKNLPFKTN